MNRKVSVTLSFLFVVLHAPLLMFIVLWSTKDLLEEGLFAILVLLAVNILIVWIYGCIFYKTLYKIPIISFFEDHVLFYKVFSLKPLTIPIKSIVAMDYRAASWLEKGLFKIVMLKDEAKLHTTVTQKDLKTINADFVVFNNDALEVKRFIRKYEDMIKRAQNDQ